MIYTAMTKKATKIAFEAHKGQLDKGGLPYICHPLHIAEQMPDEYTTTAALLHDVLEDTKLTLADLEKAGFPKEVLDALVLLKHERGVPYLDYIGKLQGNRIAVTVKLADLDHNMDESRLSSVGFAELARIDKYKKAMDILKRESTTK